MRTSFPGWLEPMAATLTRDRFTGPGWVFERKHDGIRQVAFTEWTVHGKLRHPRLLGVRTDKTAREVVRERPERPARRDGARARSAR